MLINQKILNQTFNEIYVNDNNNNNNSNNNNNNRNGWQSFVGNPSRDSFCLKILQNHPSICE